MHRADRDPGEAPSPANRLGLDYHVAPRRKTDGPITDFHTHVKTLEHARAFFDAATAYGIGHVFSMTPLDNVDALRAEYGDRLTFIAIPRWENMEATLGFRTQWIADLATFHERGARLCKFWSAPYLRQKYGLTLDHTLLRPVVDRAVELDFEFMVHVGDPSVWWRPGGKYADSPEVGTKPEQYAQLEWFLDYVSPRRVVAAHMGGYVEDLAFLQKLLDRYENLLLDSSATKWVVREIARQPEAVREFVIHNADRIVFGSDLVVDERYDWEHYASRYWVHLHLWETPYRGESPIEDPDAPDPPQLAGLDLPPAVLEKLYRANAARFVHE